MKDNFSRQSDTYAQFRPGYPDELFNFLLPLCPNVDTAWDCATGNGQIAEKLAPHFAQIIATDISENQLKNAFRAPNIHYRLEPAENPSLPDRSCALVAVGQAAHWFRFEPFYNHVRRVLQPGGILALAGYNLVEIDPETDTLVRQLYKDVLGRYWDPERRHVDAAYRNIPFPFEEISLPPMSGIYHWTSRHLFGYLQTWSAVQHFIRHHHFSPIDDTFIRNIQTVWPDDQVKTVRFPIFARISRI